MTVKYTSAGDNARHRCSRRPSRAATRPTSRSIAAARPHRGLREEGSGQADRHAQDRRPAEPGPVGAEIGSGRRKLYGVDVQGGQQVARLVQRQGLQRRRRHAPKTWDEFIQGRRDDQGVGRARLLDRRRRRLADHRPVREHLPAPGGPDKYDKLVEARDPVDRPVGQGRADDDAGRSSATRATSSAAPPAPSRPTSRRRSGTSSPIRPRARRSSRATSSRAP